MKVIVTGSLGNVSQPLTRLLQQRGHAVTVISSNPARQPAIGSLDDAALMAVTFAGADAAYLMVPQHTATPDNRAYHRRIGGQYARAVERAGARRVVHLSSMGAELPAGTGLVLGSYEVEASLRRLPGVALTHVRAGYFYTNLLQFAGMLREQGHLSANYGAADHLVLAALRDIAAAAEELLARALRGQQRAPGPRMEAAIGRPALTWRG